MLSVAKRALSSLKIGVRKKPSSMPRYPGRVKSMVLSRKNPQSPMRWVSWPELWELFGKSPVFRDM